ncbi:HAMP domain-containing protein [Flavobacterium sp. 7E]|uniref:HAMP domain-containing protein n=1 Tax=Flavobacterium sp. 7E TaxID=2735898 RepID=UPI00352FDD7A
MVSVYYINSIKQDTQNILKANYDSLEYSRNMLMAMEGIVENNTDAIVIFGKNLDLQLLNITEKNEANMTNKLKTAFQSLKEENGSAEAKAEMNDAILQIMKLNTDAIKLKSDIAQKTAETANFYIMILGTLCFLIAFNLLVNLPNNIANPIKELTTSIQEIANKNYSERVRFLQHSEFGDLARCFNVMAEKLEEYNNSSLYSLYFEKKRLETLINKMHDPIIGLDTAILYYSLTMKLWLFLV